jgi:hypothetical protein
MVWEQSTPQNSWRVGFFVLLGGQVRVAVWAAGAFFLFFHLSSFKSWHRQTGNIWGGEKGGQGVYFGELKHIVPLVRLVDLS